MLPVYKFKRIGKRKMCKAQRVYALARKRRRFFRIGWMSFSIVGITNDMLERAFLGSGG